MAAYRIIDRFVLEEADIDSWRAIGESKERIVMRRDDPAYRVVQLFRLQVRAQKAEEWKTLATNYDRRPLEEQLLKEIAYRAPRVVDSEAITDDLPITTGEAA